MLNNLVKPLEISNLDDYFKIIKIMISKVNQDAKSLIINVLQKDSFSKLSKVRKNFIVNVLWCFLSIKGKINFLQLERYSSICEQTFRNHFKKTFDFLSFNKELMSEGKAKNIISCKLAIALDPSYIPKSGKSTYGRGKYWSGVAKSAKWGLDICGFAVVDADNNTALHLKAFQTPSAKTLEEDGLNLLTHYAKLVSDNSENFKDISPYLLADAYFSKKTFVDSVTNSGMHLISRLRDDSVLRYKYNGEKTGKRGTPRKFSGNVNRKDLDENYFSMELDSEDLKIYSAIVYSKAFKKDIKLAVAIFYKEENEVARKLYFSTDLTQNGRAIVEYYRSRFQIEFLYRDAKQSTGLTDCEARSKEKLDFHFNTSLTAVNIAKYDWLSAKNQDQKPFSMANYKTLYNNALMLERFICMFAINPNTQKNKRIIQELLDYGKIAA